MSEVQEVQETAGAGPEVMSNVPDEQAQAVDTKQFAGDIPHLELGKNVLFLDPDEIVVDPGQNMRRYEDEKGIPELAKDIVERGQVQPVLVRKTEAGKYTLVFGFRRVKAIRHANEQGLYEVPAGPLKVAALNAGDLDNLGAFTANVAENMKRKDLSPIDHMYIIKTFTDGGMSKRDVSKLLGRAPSWVTEHAQIGEMRPKIQKGVHDGRIPYTVVREMIGMTDEEQDEFLVELEKSAGKDGKVTGAREKARNKKRAKGGKKKGGGEVSIVLTMKEARTGLTELAGCDLAEGAECKYSEQVQDRGMAILKYLDGKLGVKALANRLEGK